MKKPCGNTHPIFNRGSIQTNRAPRQLHPDSTPYDERTVSDWLVYLTKYAKHINYFGLEDTSAASGDWESFFSKDISVLLARIAEEQIVEIQFEINAIISALQNNDLTPQEAREEFTLLFAHVFNIIWRLNDYYINLEPGQTFKSEIENRALTNIEVRLERLIAYYKSAKSASLFDEPTDQNLPEGYQEIFNLKNWALETIWFKNSGKASWLEYVNSISSDKSPFEHNVLTPANDAERINLAAHYQLLVEAIKGIVKAFAGLILKANEAFQETITNLPDHQPDRALLIAFLKLLDLYREEINTLTKRHLDHYYKDVLQLENKQPQPDKVFLVAELAKNTNEAKISEGAEFKGGKDADGIELVYASTKETIVNKAAVSSLKSVLKTDDKIYAGQNVTTADGLEEELEFPENGWPAFGTNAFPEAELGFGFASDHLFMVDGERKITITLTVKQDLSISKLNLIDSRSRLRVSGKEEWIYIESISVKRSSTNKKKLIISGTINSDAGEISAINKEVHERTFYPELPVVEFLIDSRDHAYLQQIQVESTDLKVDVTGSKHATISTVLGATDSSKPFQAFGAIPRVGNSVIIGAQEMLSKNLSELKVKVRWSSKATGEKDDSNLKTSTTNLDFEQLTGNSWTKPTISATSKSGGRMHYSWSGLTKQPGHTPKQFSKDSISGFLRLKLKNDIGHPNYPSDLANYALAVAKNPDTAGNPPNPYHIPSIEEFEIDYVANATLSVAKSSSYKTEGTSFFHITPFGGYEACGNVLQESYPSVVPIIANEGEFYIGVNNFGGGQRASLLIHILEGSANPLKAKQEVTWKYLHKNVWVEFEPGNIEDGTDGLIKTGLLDVSLPFNYSNSATYFNDNIVWIKAEVAQHVDAVCMVINVYAQGLEAVLTSTGHSNAHYETALPTETISKFKVSQPTIKKITQPVESADGEPEESDEHFYTRVSERLRHKNRAITIWDYERLTLEEFKELAMTKALSHTKYFVDPVTNNLDYSESAPGNVSVICVPKKSENEGEIQKPYTPVDTLEEVKEYLETLCPDWSTLHVRNPIFEEVQVDCRVQFLPHIKDTDYYLGVLHKDLEQFLSPWLGDNSETLKFGWRVHKSRIIDFLDERPYVDYVRDVKVNQVFSEDPADRKDNVNEAIPRYAISVLVSSKIHVLNLV